MKTIVIPGLAIVCITAINLMLLSKGINGTVSLTCVALIAAIAGHPIWEFVKGVTAKKK